MSSVTLCLPLACLLLLVHAHGVPVSTVKRTRGKSVSVLQPKGYHAAAVVNPVASAINSKAHKNAFLASAYHMPHAYAPLGVMGMGGMNSYFNQYAGGVNPYMYNGYGHGGYGGYGAGYGGYGGFMPVATGVNSHDSYYSNHMGYPNGYNVNSQAIHVPNAFGYPTLGGECH